MPSSVDLHTHTTVSDGTLSPVDLLKKAEELSIRHLGVADHDSTAGYEAVLAASAAHPSVQLIPAIEINAEGALSCHILGYFYEVRHSGLQKQLARYREQRLTRARAMIGKLQVLGVALEFEDVQALSTGESMGRPHIADALIKKGVVNSRQKAFDRYLKKDGPAYVPGESPSAEEAIRLIREARGVPVLAHPCYYTSDEFFRQLVDVGLMGIEAYYPEHSRGLTKRYLELAEQYHLAVSGGSDFHGPRTGRTALGCVDVPESVLDSLRQAQTRL